jgi:hypothetical protein
MPPTPTPIESEIEKVREIARLRSYSQTATLVDSLNDSQWANTLTDITEWSQRRDKYTDVIKGPAGAQLKAGDRKLAITNRVRERLGLEAITNLGGAAVPAGWGTMTVTTDE